MKTAFVLCGALAREVVAIVKRRGWDVQLFGIASSDHSLPMRIAPHVEHKLREVIPLFERVVVVYGDCGTGGTLDEVLARYNVPRISGPHCYEMYGGAAHDAMMAQQPGTFFLTDFLVRGFEGTIWKTLGLDRFPELRDDYFRHYTRIVYLQQNADVTLIEKARVIADRLCLPLELHASGYGELERRLVMLMDELYAPKFIPQLPASALHEALPARIDARHRTTRQSSAGIKLRAIRLAAAMNHRIDTLCP